MCKQHVKKIHIKWMKRDYILSMTCELAAYRAAKKKKN